MLPFDCATPALIVFVARTELRRQHAEAVRRTVSVGGGVRLQNLETDLIAAPTADLVENVLNRVEWTRCGLSLTGIHREEVGPEQPHDRDMAVVGAVRVLLTARPPDDDVLTTGGGIPTCGISRERLVGAGNEVDYADRSLSVRIGPVQGRRVTASLSGRAGRRCRTSAQAETVDQVLDHICTRQ